MRISSNLILSVLTLILLVGNFGARRSTIIGSPLQAGGSTHVTGSPAGPNDGSQSLPCNSVRQAVEQAAPGSTIVLQGGSYPERLTIGQLSNQKNLTITAQRGTALIGGYFVGTQEICIPVTRREGSPVNPNSPANCAGNPPGARAKLYYPAAAPGDAPVGCGEPFPLIVYAHARRAINYPLCDWSQAVPIQQDYYQAEGLLTRLAAAGIIVVSVDVSWSGDALTERSFVVDALAYARDENARPGSRLQGAVNLVRVGLMGHSTGGEAAIRAAACLNGRCPPELRLADVRVSAVALLAPGFEADDPHESLDVMSMNAPVLIIYGTKDTQQVHDDPLKVYAMAGRPKHLVIVTGANHYGYTDGICIAYPYDNPSQVGGVMGGPEAQARQRRAAGDYLEAFFSYYLPYLLPDTNKLDYLRQQGGQQCNNPGNPPTCGSPVRRFTDLDALNVGVSVCSCFP